MPATPIRIPVEEIGHCLTAATRLADPVGGHRLFADLPLRDLLTGAARFAESEIAPLDRLADTVGARFDGTRVALPAVFTTAYRRWCEAGWAGADAPASAGGGGLPKSVGSALNEMWHCGCMGLAMGFVLTQGAVEMLLGAATQPVRDRFVGKLVSGEWTATMAMTEPQAGTDLGLIRTRAVQAEDGTYRISGDKIFISFGDHTLTDNIVHMVLARSDPAAPGTRGLSLFAVPAMLADTDGAFAPNRVSCLGIERKLGLHGSPTCQMRYGDDGGGATGWIVGEPGRGLDAMFTMMNRARLSTGVQGVAISEISMQQAAVHAAERLQGRDETEATVPIARHPDVDRMLLDGRSLTMGVRALCCYAAATIDAAALTPDPLRAAVLESRAALLTPIVKAYGSYAGIEVASLAIQVHGGSGYVEDTGIAQRWRDARIAPIYEGANGIQAMDLVARKIVGQGPEAILALLTELAALAQPLDDHPDRLIAEAARLAGRALASACDAVDGVCGKPAHRDVLWSAAPLLDLLGMTLAGTLLTLLAADPGEEFRPPDDLPQLAAFFARNRLVLAPALAERALAARP